MALVQKKPAVGIAPPGKATGVAGGKVGIGGKPAKAKRMPKGKKK